MSAEQVTQITLPVAADMVFHVVGGLGVFLLGMKFMSEGMQAVAGNRLRAMINAITNNRLVACGVGTAVTGLIQSSSVTTVMVVGMVNAGLLSLQQAIGVILGADIGTTVTAWIVSLKLCDYGLPILGIFVFFYLFSKHERTRYISMMCLGFGMVFFGLELMKAGMDPLRESKVFHQWMQHFTPTGYLGVLKCVLIGSAVTAIVQSSSATVAITISLAQKGLIGYDTAVALVLGENIGTTITAYLASLGGSRNARRAAYAHILIKVIGVCWVMPLFFIYYAVLDFLFGSLQADDMGVGIAAAHTGFNVVNVSVFLFLVPSLARLLVWVAPDKTQKEKPRLTFLDVRMLDTPVICIQQSKHEIVRMSDMVREMLDHLRICLVDEDHDKTSEKEIFRREEMLDVMQKEVVEFLSRLLAGNVPYNVMRSGRSQLRMADEYESISDYVRNILKLLLKMKKANEAITNDALREVLELHDKVAAYVDLINTAVREEDEDILGEAHTQGDSVTYLMKDCRSRHLMRVGTGQASPIKSLVYTDILNAHRRIKDHALNIAEVVAGEK